MVSYHRLGADSQREGNVSTLSLQCFLSLTVRAPLSRNETRLTETNSVSVLSGILSRSLHLAQHFIWSNLLIERIDYE